MAKKARRYQTKNGNDPNPGNITEEKESELEEYIEYAEIIMGALGYKLFKPLLEQTQAQEQESESESTGNEPVLHLKYGQADASSQQTDEGFVVFEGSRISPKPTPSASANVHKNRERHAEKIDANGKLVDSVLLGSPYQAACFVSGASVNAKDHWKTKDGIPLGRLKS
ncbi:hypothetical protein KJY78_03650 [Canibacter sp. lx-45]|uniref:DUF4357 domain-containing protein n=1 Tax=Canibacter zhuwentaonis TaxID=2837491 RepID=UPI001BDD00DE|nr:DUF4357 domain-containing protein [Canibacter zhuwentaonis]MBT1035445.1 hypothetical protein [Canibacter zhuwentaonis]